MGWKTRKETNGWKTLKQNVPSAKWRSAKNVIKSKIVLNNIFSKDRQEQRDLMREYQINDALYQLSNTSDMANKMMEQQKLKDIMVHHYKMGNLTEAKRIQHLLEGQKKEVNIKLDDEDPDVFDWILFPASVGGENIFWEIIF